jgi:hypothetical protein
MSSRNKSKIEKQKLQHGFRLPPFWQTACWWLGKDELLLKNEKPTAPKWPDAKRYYATRILKEVIFTNPKSYLKTVNRSAIQAR